MKEFVNFLKKVLLHKWSCMTLLFHRSLCRYLSSGSLFLDKDHEGDSQYWGLTVGGQTGARFAQRKVQIKSGQSVQGVQEFRRCQGTTAANGGGGLWWQLGADEVAAILSLEGNRGGEGEKTRHNDQGWCLGWGIDGDIGSGLG